MEERMAVHGSILDKEGEEHGVRTRWKRSSGVADKVETGCSKYFEDNSPILPNLSAQGLPLLSR